MQLPLVYIFLIFLSAFLACSESGPGVDEIKPYDGPIIEVDNVETLYSDSALVRVKVEADKQLEFENGDSEFPKGIYIEFYDKEGAVSSTLKADKGYYNKDDELYTAVGDVVVISYEKDQKLNTEELHWKQDEAKVFTDKFVRIETAEEILMGEGLTAAQDFSTYRILKPTGELNIKEE